MKLRYILPVILCISSISSLSFAAEQQQGREVFKAKRKNPAQNVKTENPKKPEYDKMLLYNTTNEKIDIQMERDSRGYSGCILPYNFLEISFPQLQTGTMLTVIKEHNIKCVIGYIAEKRPYDKTDIFKTKIFLCKRNHEKIKFAPDCALSPFNYISIDKQKFHECFASKTEAIKQQIQETRTFPNGVDGLIAQYATELDEQQDKEAIANLRSL